MNEKKKLYLLLGILAAIIVLVIGLVFVSYKEQKKVYDKFVEAFNGSDNTLVYIGRPTCGYCNLLTPSLDEMTERYEFDYLYINTDELGSSFMQKILGHLNLTSVGTPYLAIVSNSKVIDTQNGYADYDEIFKFLQENNIIEEDAELLLNYIGLEEYKTKLAEDKLNVFVVGQSTCTYCVQAKLVLNELVEQKNVEVNYVNLAYLTTDEKTEFNNSLDYLSSGVGTPTVLITKGGKLIDTYEGYAPLSTYIQFLEENGVL